MSISFLEILILLVLFAVIIGVVRGTLTIQWKSIGRGVAILFLVVFAVKWLSFSSSPHVIETPTATTIPRSQPPELTYRPLPSSLPILTARDEAYEGKPPEPVEESEPVVTPVSTASSSKPAWLGQTSRRVGSAYQTVVVSDPFLTKEECDASLKEPIRKVARQYIDDLLGKESGHFVPTEKIIARQSIVKEEYVETLDTSVGPMRRLHVLLEFDDARRNEILVLWKKALRRERLYEAGGGALLILAMVGLVFGYLKFDTATQGLYRRRLQLAAAGAILVTVLIVWA